MKQGPPLRRLTWRHTNSGAISIWGEGLASSHQRLTTANRDWLNKLFDPPLVFQLEEWLSVEGGWVIVEDDK